MAFRNKIRGRGRGSMPFSDMPAEASQINKVLQPPSLYPKLAFTPLPLTTGTEFNFLLSVKQDFRRSMQESVYFVKDEKKFKDIERYSDKYTLMRPSEWKPDYNFMPKELQETKTKRKRLSVSKAKKIKLDSSILKTLDELGQKESALEVGDDQPVDEPVEEKKAEDEEIASDADSEAEEEEENDYVDNYFENGEDYGADSAGSADEAVF